MIVFYSFFLGATNLVQMYQKKTTKHTHYIGLMSRVFANDQGDQG